MIKLFKLLGGLFVKIFGEGRPAEKTLKKALTLVPQALPIVGLFVGGLAFAQGPVKLVDGNSVELRLAASGVGYNSGMTLVPTSATAVTTTTTKVQLIFCANVSAAAATLTITDNQSTPKTYFNAVSIAANQSVLVHSSTIGLPYSGGIKWTAGTANAINCQIVGVQ